MDPFAAATERLRALHAREVGVLELRDATLARVERWNGKLNAIIWTDLERARLFWAGLTGVAFLPSTVVPTGPDANGLPIGVQLVGPAYGDRVTLGAAAALEASGFAFRPPPAMPERTLRRRAPRGRPPPPRAAGSAGCRSSRSRSAA